MADDRGAAAVEFAIVLPMLLLVLFAIIDFGRLSNQQILVTQAAREGARAAALGLPAAQIQAQAALAAGGYPIATVVDHACTAASPANTNGQVTVTLSWSPATPVGGLMRLFGATLNVPVTVRATSVMSCVG